MCKRAYSNQLSIQRHRNKGIETYEGIISIRLPSIKKFPVNDMPKTNMWKQ